MRKVYALIIFFIAIILFTFFKPQPTAFVSYSPPIELFLSKTTYLPNEILEGDILLTFTDAIDTTSTISIRLKDQTKTLPITKILDSLNYDYSITASETSISNPETTKTLEFDSSDIIELAFSVPEEAEIESLDFDLEGEDYQGSKPTSPTIDLTIDNSIDWIFKGEQEDWSSDIISDGLDLSKDTSSIYIQGQNFYCSLIDLPLSSEFKISARYTKEISANLKATILRFENTASFIKSNLYCDLPTTPTSEWSDCTIELDTPIEDDYLVCLYTPAPADETKYFRLTMDDSSPYDSYQCDYAAIQGSGTCEEENADFFIKIQKPLFENELITSTFEENSVLSQQEIADYLTAYVSTCTEDDCTIPFSVSSNSAGKIILKNLQLDYSTEADYSTAEFYDLDELEKSVIYEINDEDIEDQELQIPLYLFNLQTADVLGEKETLELIVVIGSSLDSQIIDIYQYGIPATLSIERSKNILNNFATASTDVQFILGALGIDIEAELLTLADYENQLITLTEAEKTQFNTELKNYLDSLPTYILIKGKVKQQHTSTLADITDNILEDQTDLKTEIYSLQDKANVLSTSIAFWLTNYEGVQEEKTLISKTILNPLGNIYIVEKIPKTIAASVDEITILGDYLVIEQDPVIKFRGSSTTETINYLVPGNVLNLVADTVTLLIPTEGIPPAVEFACGDGVCTEPLEDALTCPQDCAKKMPWLLLIILLVILLVGVWYINFYRGEWSLRKLVEKRKLKKKEKKVIKEKKKVIFKTQADHINLRTYVLKSLQRNITKSQINKLLLQQGWTQEQIDFIYRELGK